MRLLICRLFFAATRAVKISNTICCTVCTFYCLLTLLAAFSVAWYLQATELKAELRGRGLRLSGKKAELVERLEEALQQAAA